VARALGIPEIIVPAYPGITSAVGLLTTDLKYDAIRTEFQASDGLDLERLNADFAAMQDELARQLASDGVPPADVFLQRAGDLRYVGQGYELRVPFSTGVLDRSAVGGVFACFGELHRAEYGHVFPDSPIEIVNIRVTGIGRMAKIAAPRPSAGGSLAAALVKTAHCAFRVDGGLQALPTPFYRRDGLPPETPLVGPAIILQTDSTTVVPPGATAHAHASGNLILRVEG
jgi:N-methylhydantoinase A